jgi:hypothetical protein
MLHLLKISLSIYIFYIYIGGTLIGGTSIISSFYVWHVQVECIDFDHTNGGVVQGFQWVKSV